MECIVLVVMIEVVLARHAPLDTIVQVGLIKHKNTSVQPASILTAGVHPRARTVQPASILQQSVLPRHQRARTVQPASTLVLSALRLLHYVSTVPLVATQISKEQGHQPPVYLAPRVSTAYTAVQLLRKHVRTVRRANTVLPRVLNPRQAVWLAKEVVILLTQA